MASILQAAEDLKSEDEDKDEEGSQPEVQSPTKSSSDPVNELVANARRERKVQDLEITNASLEAINRTLERQLRKQTAELRRFRRLSRAGRISLTSGTSSRKASEALTDPPVNLSDLSEEEASEEDEEEPDSLHDSDFSSDASGAADEMMSADDKIVARRKRDESRLQLDLTKHQELLVDSQKINQSIKRCMDWTEVLIKEGQKALEYHVRVSDVQLGGHVLAPSDMDEDDRSSLKSEDGQKEPKSNLDPHWGKPSQDRDSGIELHVDGA